MSGRIRERGFLRRLWWDEDPGADIFRTTFSQPLGTNLEPGEVRGYYIDLSIKSGAPTWPPWWLRRDAPVWWVAVAQFGLGCHERYLSGEGGQWLEAAVRAGDELLAKQHSDSGPRDGAWLHEFPFPHTFQLQVPWASAIAQGEGASLLVRLADLTGEDRYAEAALRALAPMRVSSGDGGLAAELEGGYFPEEYPTAPPSHVLNGGIFGLWGCHDVAVGLGDVEARDLFEAGVATLEANLHRYDTGYWSRYDLFPHPVMNIASAAYHELHVDQLKATAMLSGSEALAAGAARFEAYRHSRMAAARAFARKVAFRLAVPRNPLLSRRRREQSHTSRPSGLT